MLEGLTIQKAGKGAQMSFFHFLLVTLACYRVSELLADPWQAGPWRSLERLRDWVGIHVVEPSAGDSGPTVERQYRRGGLGQLVDCAKCSSIWVAAALLLVDLAGGHWLIVILAVSGAVTLWRNHVDTRGLP